MPLAWDTTLVSRIYPGARYHDMVAQRALADPVVLCAPSVMEVMRGLTERAAAGDSRFARAADWFADLFHGPETQILSFDGIAAAVAGELLAAVPLPPSGRGRGEVKAARRARWLLDVQIAATAWCHGYGIATENVDDFRAISGAIADTYAAAPLEVAGPDRL